MNLDVTLLSGAIVGAVFVGDVDRAGIITRVHVYQDAGYFPPHELDMLVAKLNGTRVSAPPRILANFARRYG